MAEHPSIGPEQGREQPRPEPKVRPLHSLKEPDRVLDIPEESVFAHPEDVRWRKEKRRFIAEHGKWLRRYRWHLFLTFTFPESLSLERAMNVARRWLELAGPDMFAFAAYELGKYNGHGHVHLLVGGRMNGGAVYQREGKWIWRYAERDFEITGWSWVYFDTRVTLKHVDLYDPKGGAAFYLSKYLFETPEHGEFIRTPRRPKRRKRGN